MSEPFSAKLGFVLKALSLSRGALAAELAVNKSMVGRWVSGSVRPSGHNLSRISEHVARRVNGFTTLDWERPVVSLAALIGADPDTVPGADGGPPLELFPLTLLSLSRTTTAVRGAAYEGFFRSTRPFFQSPGTFIHDQMMIRRDPGGLLRFAMLNAGVRVEGSVLLLHSECFVVGADLTGGTCVFGIFNGVSTVQAAVLDGLILISTHDPSRSPVATAMLLERVGDLTGDPAADDAHLVQLGKHPPLAPRGSVPKAIADHLARDIGPGQIPTGGDWLLCMPSARSLSKGADQTN